MELVCPALPQLHQPVSVSPDPFESEPEGLKMPSPEIPKTPKPEPEGPESF